MQNLIHPVAEVRSVDGERAEWFHICDKETFIKIKSLHGAYWRACHRLAAYFRWEAKQVQNRTVGRWERNEKGQRIRWVKTGDQPEPARCGVFTSSYDQENRNKTIPDHIPDEGIIGTYELARKPYLNQEDADKANVTIDHLLIEHLWAQLKAQEEPETEPEPVVDTVSYAR